MKRKRKARYCVEVASLSSGLMAAGCNLTTKTTDLLKNTAKLEQWQAYGERYPVGAAMMIGDGRGLSSIPYAVKAVDRITAIRNVRNVLHTLRDGQASKLFLACDGEIVPACYPENAENATKGNLLCTDAAQLTERKGNE